MMVQGMYAADLANLFHEVTYAGAATIRTADLMRWLGRDKQVASFWADVQSLFVDALEPLEREEGWRLFSWQYDGMITLLCLDPEDTAEEDRWWTSVRSLTESKSKRPQAPKAVELKKGVFHEANLANFFDRITRFGAATMRTSDLMRWMGWDSQKIGFWQEIQKRFEDALEHDSVEAGWRAFSLQQDGEITLVCMDPEDAGEADRWWVSVEEAAKKPAPGRRRSVVVED